MTYSMIMTGLLQGLILALLSYAVMIPFRILNIADITAEGLYPLVGGISAVMITTYNFNPSIVILIAALVGATIGGLVSIVITKLYVNSLLAGIIISTMLYSITLRVMGKPNIALLTSSTLFTTSTITNVVILMILVSVLVGSLYALLHTQVGLRMRALGYNSVFARRNGISMQIYTFLGLAIAGVFTGVAAFCIVQLQRYMDINIGVGICIHALAALMIGEAIVGTKTMLRQLLAPLVGALVYQQIQGCAFSYGLAPSDLKFFTGLLVLIVIAIGTRKNVKLS